MVSISNQFKPDLDLRMLTNKRIVQNGFHAQIFWRFSYFILFFL